jgi:AGZA family xanthine/uracil permease-like MFS transporter
LALRESALVREIPFGDLDEGFPALLTMTLMPFTYSITNGIGAGFVAFTFIKLVHWRARQIHPMMHVATAAFVVYFVWH